MNEQRFYQTIDVSLGGNQSSDPVMKRMQWLHIANGSRFILLGSDSHAYLFDCHRPSQSWRCVVSDFAGIERGLVLPDGSIYLQVGEWIMLQDSSGHSTWWTMPNDAKLLWGGGDWLVFKQADKLFVYDKEKNFNCSLHCLFEVHHVWETEYGKFRIIGSPNRKELALYEWNLAAGSNMSLIVKHRRKYALQNDEIIFHEKELLPGVVWPCPDGRQILRYRDVIVEIGTDGAIEESVDPIGFVIYPRIMGYPITQNDKCRMLSHAAVCMEGSANSEARISSLFPTFITAIPVGNKTHVVSSRWHRTCDLDDTLNNSDVWSELSMSQDFYMSILVHWFENLPVNHALVELSADLISSYGNQRNTGKYVIKKNIDRLVRFVVKFISVADIDLIAHKNQITDKETFDELTLHFKLLNDWPQWGRVTIALAQRCDEFSSDAINRMLAIAYSSCISCQSSFSVDDILLERIERGKRLLRDRRLYRDPAIRDEATFILKYSLRFDDETLFLATLLEDVYATGPKPEEIQKDRIALDFMTAIMLRISALSNAQVQFLKEQVQSQVVENYLSLVEQVLILEPDCLQSMLSCRYSLNTKHKSQESDRNKNMLFLCPSDEEVALQLIDASVHDSHEALRACYRTAIRGRFVRFHSQPLSIIVALLDPEIKNRIELALRLREWLENPNESILGFVLLKHYGSDEFKAVLINQKHGWVAALWEICKQFDDFWCWASACVLAIMYRRLGGNLDYSEYVSRMATSSAPELRIRRDAEHLRDPIKEMRDVITSANDIGPEVSIISTRVCEYIG